MTTKNRWKNLCQTLGISNDHDPMEYQRIITAYNEPHRAYHTLQHLSECLGKLDWAMAESLPQDKALVEMALWYHDVIYDTSAQDNELKSAKWAVSFLSRAGLASELCESVHALIMATCHGETPTDPLQQWVVDIDLAILGADDARFAEYEVQVRQEYSWVPLDIYKVKRREVLQQFLDLPRLYQAASFYKRYEDKARQNLHQAMKHFGD